MRQPSSTYYALLPTKALFITALLFTSQLAQAQPDAFITTWNTANAGSSNSTSITIPTTGGGYIYDADWNNDGIYEQTGITGDVTHNFGTAGTYTIRIKGSFPRIYFNNGGDKLKILSINQWGTNGWTNMQHAFYGCSNLTQTATDVPDLSLVTDMSFMFQGNTSFNGDLSGWNVASVTNMQQMFQNATTFNSAIGNWNVSAVTQMTGMLQGATTFNQNLGNWTFNSGVVLVDLLSTSGMSTSNYDNTLNGWNNNMTTPDNLTIGVGGLKYCNGTSARTNLDGPKGWTFSDDAKDCAGITYQTANSGLWASASTWLPETVPPATSNANIRAGHTVTLESSATCNGLTIESTGKLSLNNGTTLTLTSGGSSNGTIQGTTNSASNTINGGAFVNAMGGTLSPGASPGCVNFGNELTNIGTIPIEVNGTSICTQYDRINVNGTANLGGTLLVTIDYSPINGDMITFLDATSISGTFASVSGLPAGWSLVYNAPNDGEVSLQYAVLPIQLVSFEANRKNSHETLLTWRTATELNNEGFYIERSTAGDTWKSLGFVSGHGTTQEEKSYSFTDERTLNGTNYYRLRQVDFDGNFEYSEIRSVVVKEVAQELEIYPNPVSNQQLNVNFKEEMEGATTLRIFGANGKMLHQEALDNQFNQTNYGHLPIGIYFMEVTNGKNVWRERLIIAHPND